MPLGWFRRRFGASGNSVVRQSRTTVPTQVNTSPVAVPLQEIDLGPSAAWTAPPLQMAGSSGQRIDTKAALIEPEQDFVKYPARPRGGRRSPLPYLRRRRSHFPTPGVRGMGRSAVLALTPRAAASLVEHHQGEQTRRQLQQKA